MEKIDLRKKIAETIKSFSPERQSDFSKKVCEKIVGSEEYKSADLVLSYMAMKNELDPLVVSKNSMADGKILFLPKTESVGRKMDFYMMNPALDLFSQLRQGRWGIWEPNEKCPVLNPNAINGKKVFVVVPGVGFSLEGNRLGHGMGFYDTYIPRLKKWCEENGSSLFLAGVCFPCQICDAVKTLSDSHDIVMDKLFF